MAPIRRRARRAAPGRGVGAQHARAERDRHEAAREAAALSSSGARPPSGPLRTTSSAGGPHRRGSDRAARRGRRADGARLSSQRPPATAGSPSSRSQASKRDRHGDARNAGAAALLARRAATACQWRCRASARSPARRSTERSQTSGWIAATPSSVAFSTRASMRSLAGMPIASVTCAPAARARPPRRRADAQLDRVAADADDLAPAIRRRRRR